MNLYRGGKARQKCTCIDRVETFAKQMFLHVLFSAGLHFSLNHDLDFVFLGPWTTLFAPISQHPPPSLLASLQWLRFESKSFPAIFAKAPSVTAFSNSPPPLSSITDGLFLASRH